MVGTGGNDGENDEDNDGKIQSGIDSEDGANQREKDEDNGGEGHCVGSFSKFL